MEPAAVDEASSLEAEAKAEAEAKQAIQAHVLPVGEEVARLTRGAEGEAVEALAARLGPPLEQACEQACAALAGCVVSALPSLSEQRRQVLQERLLEVAMEALHHGLAPALANSERAAARTSEPAAQISISADSGGGADPATASRPPTQPTHLTHPTHLGRRRACGGAAGARCAGG